MRTKRQLRRDRLVTQLRCLFNDTCVWLRKHLPIEKIFVITYLTQGCSNRPLGQRLSNLSLRFSSQEKVDSAVTTTFLSCQQRRRQQQKQENKLSCVTSNQARERKKIKTHTHTHTNTHRDRSAFLSNYFSLSACAEEPPLLPLFPVRLMSISPQTLPRPDYAPLQRRRFSGSTDSSGAVTRLISGKRRVTWSPLLVGE